MFALACKRKLSKAQREIRASNVWQDGIVHAPYVSEVQLNRLGLRSKASLYNRRSRVLRVGAD